MSALPQNTVLNGRSVLGSGIKYQSQSLQGGRVMLDLSIQGALLMMRMLTKQTMTAETVLRIAPWRQSHLLLR
jgi:hypothetical protein